MKRRTLRTFLYTALIVAATSIAWVRSASTTHTPAASAATFGESTGNAGAVDGALPPVFVVFRHFALTPGNGLANRPATLPLAQIDHAPASLSNVSASYFTDPGAAWATPPPGAVSDFRLNSAVRYEGGGQVVVVDVVQPSRAVESRGVSLPGDVFTLPNGLAASICTAAGRDGLAYIVQWQQGGFLVQLILEGSGSYDTAKALAGQVSLTR